MKKHKYTFYFINVYIFMSNLEIITRGLCVIGKIDSITERTYKDKNDVEQKSRNIKVIYEGGSIQL